MDRTSKVISRDGTPIAYEQRGEGPPLIVVDGAFCSRAMGPGKDLAPHLAERFSVVVYDRRGRGESGDTAPYAVERELEDLEALIERAGGGASVFGHSSGASLALEAARQGLPIERLALYEAPMVVDDSRPPVGDDYLSRLEALIAAGRRGDAVKLFMTEGVRVPGFFALVMPLLPMWQRLKAVADTVIYDSAIVDEHLHGKPLPVGRWATVTQPTLILAGGRSPAWMQNAMDALAGALPAAEHRTLAGQTHMLKPKVVAPVLEEFLGQAQSVAVAA